MKWWAPALSMRQLHRITRVMKLTPEKGDNMNMFQRVGAGLVALFAVFGVTFGIVGVASAAGTKPKVQRIYHPCDLNKNTKSARGTGSVEDLCLRVWGHPAYTVANRDGSYQESPAGPAVVTDLLSHGGSPAYLRAAFKDEIKMYGKRQR